MATRSQQTQRRTGIKSCIDMEDSRRKREEQTNGLRKNKREESLQKRRNFGAESAPSSPVVSSLHPHATSTTSTTGSSSSSTANDMNRLHDLVAGLASDDFMHVLDCTTRIRKLLSVKHNPPIDAVIQAGSIPRLLHLLSLVGHPQIQFEACWALTNVASGSLDQTMAVVNANAIPLFCQLLEVPSADVREQALWALANIAGENPQLRDLVLSFNAVELTILQFTGNPSVSMIRNATWALSNFCRGAPTTPAVSARLLPVLAQLIRHSDDAVAQDATWAVNYLSQDGEAAAIQRICETPGLVQGLVNNLMNPIMPNLITPTLRALGNVVTGNEAQTQLAIDAGFCSALVQHLKSKKKAIRKETCWAFSNITAGTAAQIQSLFDTPNAISELIKMFNTDDADIRKECTWLFTNITCGGTPKQIREVIRLGLLRPLCAQLDSSRQTNDAKILLIVLQSIHNILKVGEKENKISCELTAQGYSNPYAAKIEEFGGLDSIEELQGHSDSNIYKAAMAILEEFYDASEEENENMDPNQLQQASSYDLQQDKKLAVTPQAFNFGMSLSGNAAPMTFSF